MEIDQSQTQSQTSVRLHKTNGGAEEGSQDVLRCTNVVWFNLVTGRAEIDATGPLISRLALDLCGTRLDMF
jgi:hypothetical protein